MSCQAILKSGTILRYIIYVLSWKLIWNGWQLKEKKTYEREREREREREWFNIWKIPMKSKFVTCWALMKKNLPLS